MAWHQEHIAVTDGERFVWQISRKTTDKTALMVFIECYFQVQGVDYTFDEQTNEINFQKNMGQGTTPLPSGLHISAMYPI